MGSYAADDAHFQPQDPSGRAAWVQVRAESLDPAALLTALKAGHYYASTGPEIHAIRLHDGQPGGSHVGRRRTGKTCRRLLVADRLMRATGLS